MNWWSFLEFALAVVAGIVINWFFSRRSSEELRREAEKLRRLTINLTYMLEEQGLIEVSERNPVTGEPTKWPVTKEVSLRWAVEAPTPRWKRLWRRFYQNLAPTRKVE